MNFKITDKEFSHFKTIIFDVAGIDLAPEKKSMVTSRLAKRLRHYKLSDYSAYLELLNSGQYPQERQILIDQLTTNETYFFREPKHFDFLQKLIVSKRQQGGGLRIWSGASSTGEEAYSIAMVLADKLGSSPWEVIGTDLSSRVLSTARTGHYNTTRIDGIPKNYLRRYCLKGSGPYENTLLINSEIRRRVSFVHANLNTTLPDLGGQFDVIFLRNVMIYFNQQTKKEIVQRILALLKPGGYFLIGHSESLKDITDSVEAIAPSIFQKSTTNKVNYNEGVALNAS